MKSKSVYTFIIIICFSLALVLCIFTVVNNKKSDLNDAKKFKNQYEELNNIDDLYTKEKFLTLNINDDNPMIYKTAKEIVDILNNETAIIFMGYPESNLTRTILPIFLDVLSENKISKVYYLDIFEIRDEFIFSGSIMPEQIKKGSIAYYEIVDYLSEYLEEYYVNDEDGNRYDTLVKRVNTPTIVTVKNGKVLDYHYGAVIYHNEENYILNELEQNKLKEIFQEIITNYLNNTTICSSAEAC